MRLPNPLFAAVLALLPTGCGETRTTGSVPSCDPDPAAPAAGSFADAFAERGEIRLSSSGDQPVMGVRAVDVLRPEGHLLLVDSRTNDVKVADASGRVLRTMGRYGEGPGEFTALYDAVFLDDGRVLALDAGNSRASLFEATGEFASGFAIRGQDPRSLAVAGPDAVVVGGIVASPGEGPYAAATYALDGSRASAFLPADSLVFRTNLMVDQVWVAALPDDMLAVSLSLTPDVHLFSTAGVHACAQTAEPPGWSQLLPRAERPTSLADARAWIESATLGGVMAFAGGRLYRQYGELLAEYDAGLRLVAVHDSLPGDLVGSDGESLIFAGEETPDDAPIYMYVPRAEGES